MSSKLPSPLSPAPSSNSSTHRATWGSASRLSEDLWRIRLQNTRGALQVNTYVYATAEITVVIDPGWPWTVDGLAAALKDLDLAVDLNDVDRWLYTHSHIDHMGSAVLLQARSSAPHMCWSATSAEFEQWHAFQDRVNDWMPWVEAAFEEPHRSAYIAAHQERQRIKPTPGMVESFGPGRLENVQLFELDEVLSLGDLNLRVVDSRGHDPYHVSFFEPARGWLFSGDAILAVPTPISPPMADDLALYEQSVERLAGLGATHLFPGHGMHHTQDLDRSFERSRNHVRDYRDGISNLLAKASRPMGLCALALALTPEQEPLKPQARWWVHLALVDSHVQALLKAGLVSRIDSPAGPTYEALSVTG